MCRLRHIAAMPLQATPPVCQRQTRPDQKHPFPFPKKSRRGKSQKICKGFSERGAAQLCCARRRGLHLSAILLKIGSDLRVKVHQDKQQIQKCSTEVTNKVQCGTLFVIQYHICCMYYICAIESSCLPKRNAFGRLKAFSP